MEPLKALRRNTNAVALCISSATAKFARQSDEKSRSKAGPGQKKIALIESMNPRWQDLSEHWGWRFVVNGQSMKETDEADARKIKLKIGSSPKSHAGSN